MIMRGLALLALTAAAVGEPVVPTRPETPPPPYRWLERYDAQTSIATRISPPAGFTRTPLPEGGFGAWLRDLPLKPGVPAVHLYDGSLKRNQEAHAAVIDIDVGKQDLQQCADLVIRLRGEYLFASGKPELIRFRFESGSDARFSAWAEGFRPVVTRRDVSWKKTASPTATHDALRQYLTTVFQYASTRSLIRELEPVPVGPPEVGDVLIAAGSPGHAVIVVDRAVNAETGEVAFLLAQSYMPAQEPHVLKSFDGISPWYRASDADELKTPEWKFKRSDWRRFPAD